MTLNDLAHRVAGEWGVVPSRALEMLERLTQVMAEDTEAFAALSESVGEYGRRLRGEVDARTHEHYETEVNYETS